MEELVPVRGTVYGVHVRGRLPAVFQEYLVETDARVGTPLEVLFRRVDALPEVDETWVSEPEEPADPGRFGLFRLEGGFGLTVTFPADGHFRCGSRGVTIEWTGSGIGAAHAFVSYALPLWLEARGIPVFHGSAVVVGGRAAGFVGRSGVGKSVLCAELVELGCGFLSDDGLALRRDDGDGWRCAGGSPFLRLWPSGLEDRLRIAAEELPRVHRGLEKRRLAVEPGSGGRGLGDALPLGAVYVLDRRPGPGGPVEIAPCPGPDALARLVEHSSAAAAAAALGLSGRRFDLLADVVERIPVRFLRYPSSSDSAPRVRDAIAEDLGGKALPIRV